MEPNTIRFIYNDDSCSVNYTAPPFTTEKVSSSLDYLKGSQVDCLCWKVYRRFIADWPSKVCETMYELSEKENHDPSLEANSLRMALYRNGVDYLPILIKQAQDNGLRFFGSFRMNDCHHRSSPSSAPEFWKKHQHYRLWEVTDGRSYYNATLDYSYPEVREKISEAIFEFAEMYDVDGIELDFYRNPYLFQPSEAWSKRDILTDFVQGIRTRLTEISQKKKRPIDLLARVPFPEDRFSQGDENRLKLAGMDVEHWIRNKIVDILVMTFGTNNFNQQVEPWKSLCRENHVLFYPGIELSSATHADHSFVAQAKPDVVMKRLRAMAQNFLAQEVDGLYLFNYPCLLFETQWDPTALTEMAGLLSEVGELETLKAKEKQYTFWKNLPITLESNRPPQYHQSIKFCLRDPDAQNDGTKFTLSFRQVAERNPHAKGSYEQNPIVAPGWITYILNGHDIEAGHIKSTAQPAGELHSGFTVTEHELIEINIPPGMIVAGENLLGFHIRRFPEDRDPYINIYELTVDVTP